MIQCFCGLVPELLYNDVSFNALCSYPATMQTAAFALPTLERLLFRPKRVHAIRVLILTPTRELAVQ